MRLMEFSPFIFTMSDDMFNLYMKVLEASRDGEIVAFNGCTQRQVVDRTEDWTAWQIKKRSLRDLQGCDDVLLRKLRSIYLPRGN
ncbi:unnamed protein product [Calypogeia fissa]